MAVVHFDSSATPPRLERENVGIVILLVCMNENTSLAAHPTLAHLTLFSQLYTISQIA